MAQNSLASVADSKVTVATAVRWKFVMPTLLVIWIVGMVDKIGVAVIATNTQFLQEMNLTNHPSLVGLLVTVMLFAYGIGFPIWGLLVDRIGPKQCTVYGLMLWALSTAMAALAQSYAVLLVSRIVLGLAEAYLWPASNALTARWFPLSERGRAKAIWINGINIGLAISGFVVNGLIGSLEWRGVFWFLTICAVVICLPMAVSFLKDCPDHDHRVSASEVAYIQQEQLTEKEHDEHAKDMKSSSFWLAVLVNIANVFGVFGLATWFPSYLTGAKHFSHAATSNYIALAFGLCMVMTTLVGMVTDKTRRKAIWGSCGFLISMFVLIIVPFVQAPIYDALLVVVAILCIQGITTLVNHGIMHSFTVTEHIGRDNGTMVGISNLLAAFGPTIMGALIGFGGYSLAFAFLAACFLVGTVGHAVLVRQGY
ncbi:MFS transporter [Alicyclobacillus shizuokensis]|uniref:MFS transporter n=1 Tax=Alicyclobacillus shizuokensis TaxID=392014 RepID=UPI0008315C96|nr:MFS transporter [Alicyclobacillus shizuokensis]